MTRSQMAGSQLGSDPPADGIRPEILISDAFVAWVKALLPNGLI